MASNALACACVSSATMRGLSTRLAISHSPGPYPEGLFDPSLGSPTLELSITREQRTQLPKEPGTRIKLRSYFDRNLKALPLAAITGHFRDVLPVTLNYNLQALVKEGFILRRKRGIYQRNAAFQSPEQKRQAVTDHISANGSRIQPGANWKPGVDILTESVNPVAFASLGKAFGESIIARMRTNGFTDPDVRFIEDLVNRVFPLPEKA
jgi:hypothetical protein